MPPAHREVGFAALIAAVWLVIGNLTHPVGSTEIYTDGVAFVEYTDAYWVINHLLLAVVLAVTPWLAWAWKRTLVTTRGATWGTFALLLVGMGTVVSVFHVGGLDGVAIPAYGQVLEGGGAGAGAGADVLLKVHLASITAWSILLWGGAQTAVGVAEWLEGARRWLAALLVVCGGLGFAFAFTIAVQGHLTGFSEGVFLRGSTVGFTVWFIWTAWRLARQEVSEQVA